ncbi:MAG: hypothetical protein WAT29_06740 [Thiolinea sp.]
MTKFHLPKKSCITLLLVASLPVSAAWNGMPYNGMGLNPMSGGMGMPGSLGFSPWSMGSNPWSSGFSPWSMGGASPWSSGVSPWNMGANSPWSGGNGWNSSMWPWGSNGSGGNAWGNNAWMPWSNNSGFSGRRNNNDWVSSMFLMNSLNNQNNQQPWAMGLPTNYPYQTPVWNQGLTTPPSQPLPAMIYPQSQAPSSMPSMANPNPVASQSTQATTESLNFPPPSSSFSPFMSQPAPAPSTVVNPKPAEAQSVLPMPNPRPQGKTLVFPDGSQF